MTQYAKIINNTLEFAPRDKDGVSNWINDEEAVLAEGYLPYSPTEYPTDGKRYETSYVEEDGVITTVYIEIPYTYEEIRQTRENLYREHKDPITCQIQSLRDEEQTEEIITEIEALKIKRAEIVTKIKEENPYPEQKDTDLLNKEEEIEETVAEVTQNSTIL